MDAYMNAVLNHPWMEGTYGDKQVTCKICKVTVSTKKGYYTLRRHEEGSRHITAAAQPPATRQEKEKSGTDEEDPEYMPGSSKGKTAIRKRKSNIENEEPNVESSRTKSSGKKRKTKMEGILEKLKQMGVEYPDSPTGCCVKAAIYKGFVKITGDPVELKMVIHREKGLCGHMIDATLEDLLEQPDYGGEDYEMGLQEATVLCKDEKCAGGEDSDNEDEVGEEGRTYVTGLCKGQPSFNSGKFHNHCNECTKGFGICIGDYRMAHCDFCGKHYWRGCSGYACPCQGDDGGDDYFGGW